MCVLSVFVRHNVITACYRLHIRFADLFSHSARRKDVHGNHQQKYCLNFIVYNMKHRIYQPVFVIMKVKTRLILLFELMLQYMCGSVCVQFCIGMITNFQYCSVYAA